MKWWVRIVYLFWTAYILMFYSEFFFVNEEPAFNLVNSLQTEPQTIFIELFSFALWYVGPAALFLIAIHQFQVRSIWAIILAGSLYGFAVEGIVVWQMYEALPFSISWTPLGWHVLVDVLLGWYGLQWILQKDSYWLTAVTAALLGLFWGGWATWHWGGEIPLPPASFALFALSTGIVWIVANTFLQKVGRRLFKPSKAEKALVILWAVVLFAINILPILPWAVLILPPIVLFVLAALRHNKRIETRQNILTTFSKNIRWLHFLLLGLTPILAATTYALFHHWNILLPFIDLIFPGLVVGGFLAWIMGFVKILKQKGVLEKAQNLSKVVN